MHTPKFTPPPLYTLCDRCWDIIFCSHHHVHTPAPLHAMRPLLGHHPLFTPPCSHPNPHYTLCDRYWDSIFCSHPNVHTPAPLHAMRPLLEHHPLFTPPCAHLFPHYRLCDRCWDTILCPHHHVHTLTPITRCATAVGTPSSVHTTNIYTPAPLHAVRPLLGHHPIYTPPCSHLFPHYRLCDRCWNTILYSHLHVHTCSPITGYATAAGTPSSVHTSMFTPVPPLQAMRPLLGHHPLFTPVCSHPRPIIYCATAAGTSTYIRSCRVFVRVACFSRVHPRRVNPRACFSRVNPRIPPGQPCICHGYVYIQCECIHKTG